MNPLTIQGYDDGVNVRLLKNIAGRPNQMVFITFADDTAEPVKRGKSLRGILSDYADPSLAKKEKGAWERAAVEKHNTP